MIEFFSESGFALTDVPVVRAWLIRSIQMEGCEPAHISYIFCDDAYLLDLNKRYLNHDFYTDVISFDYSGGKRLHADIFVSTERVCENAEKYKVAFSEELHRVLIHGLLHVMGYGDKNRRDRQAMRAKEEFYIDLLKCST
ncbi:MAG: rRNA maturation RNase YbeY [Flavobacteriales bacterium]